MIGAGGAAAGRGGSADEVDEEDGEGLPQAVASATSSVNPNPTTHVVPLRPLVIGLTIIAWFEPLDSLSWAERHW